MIRSLAAIVLIAIACSPASAQYYGGGWGGGGWGYHSSTLEEGIQRGYADVVRSQGMANLLNSQAAINLQDADKKYLENRLTATQTYFEMRRYNQEARRAERSSPLSNEQYVRLARQQAPARLSVSQLDPFTGQINWPSPLRREKYDALRGQIETLFQAQAEGTILADDEIGQKCDELLAALKDDIATFKQTDYIAAKNFVTSLAYEARFPRQ
ncbi:MAG TPA: hypothetical protein VFV87_14015 [Pirellulaceae bacterium]|nr:hypothetical protein [Pirellulaceae bacterium]